MTRALAYGAKFDLADSTDAIMVEARAQTAEMTGANLSGSDLRRDIRLGANGQRQLDRGQSFRRPGRSHPRTQRHFVGAALYERLR